MDIEEHLKLLENAKNSEDNIKYLDELTDEFGSWAYRKLLCYMVSGQDDLRKLDTEQFQAFLDKYMKWIQACRNMDRRDQ